MSFHNTFPDPGITHGHFRVLPQTTGGYVIVDDRRPHGDMIVKNKIGEIIKWQRADAAGDAAREWNERGLGSPAKDRAARRWQVTSPAEEAPSAQKPVELLF